MALAIALYLGVIDMKDCFISRRANYKFNINQLRTQRYETGMETLNLFNLAYDMPFSQKDRITVKHKSLALGGVLLPGNAALQLTKSTGL